MAERDEELPSSDDLVRQAREKFEEVPPRDDLATTPYDEATLESGSQEVRKPTHPSTGTNSQQTWNGPKPPNQSQSLESVGFRLHQSLRPTHTDLVESGLGGPSSSSHWLG